MGIELKTHKLLWGRSGNRCAFEECRKELVLSETETDNESIIGDEAHIVAKSIDGPRGKNKLSVPERDKYDNLILLCKVHHKQIDDQPEHFTVEKLIQIKKNHELWVKTNLQIEPQKEKDDLRYADYIDKLIKMFDFENWNGWTSFLLGSGQPHISYKKLKELELIPDYIVSRFWPKRYTDLENSIFNMKNVLNDVIKVFYKYVDYDQMDRAKTRASDFYVWTEKFYKHARHDHKLEQELYKKFEYHVDLMDDLTYELTRSGNLFIDMIRKYIYSKYREEEGKLLVTEGPFIDLSWKTYKVEYSVDECKNSHPYNGLEKFMIERTSRDLFRGEGVNNDYFPNKFF